MIISVIFDGPKGGTSLSKIADFFEKPNDEHYLANLRVGISKINSICRDLEKSIQSNIDYIRYSKEGPDPVWEISPGLFQENLVEYEKCSEHSAESNSPPRGNNLGNDTDFDKFGNDYLLYNTTTIAETMADRCNMFVGYLERFDEQLHNECGIIRIMTGFTSFSIPVEPPTHHSERWIRRDGDNFDITVALNMHKERLKLQKLAERFGCKLIINPNARVPYKLAGDRNGLDRTRIRLVVLKEFLEDFKKEPHPGKLELVIVPESQQEDLNVTIVGKSFMARAIIRGEPGGYMLSSFTENQNSIDDEIEKFDQKFDYLVEKFNKEHNESDLISYAVECINKNLLELNKLIDSPRSSLIDRLLVYIRRKLA